MSTIKVTNIQNASATNTAMVLDTAGTVKAYSTISVGNATPSSSGAGITFPATQSASTDANTLDDYEEGTWTPSLGGNTTYTNQTGVYTKIGRQVTAKFRVDVSSIGTGSTTAISGLPFTVGSAGSVAPYFDTVVTSVVTVVGLTGSTSITFYSATAAGTDLGSNALFKSGTTFDGIVTYFV